MVTLGWDLGAVDIDAAERSRRCRFKPPAATSRVSAAEVEEGLNLYRRDMEAIRRAAERRKREDSAERLNKKVPALESMSIHIRERPADGSGYEIKYVKHIVVERAPALFEIPCVDRHCKGGGHDLTRKVLAALRKGKTEFEGKDLCSGDVEGERCDLELKFVVEATYG